LLATGFALLLTAWMFSTQPFQAPDEAMHYVRALGIANGQLLGYKARYINPALPPAQNRWLSYNTTLVMVPANLRPSSVPCYNGAPDVSSCWAATTNGDFPPLPYLLPALALKVSPNVSTAWWLTRVASALPSLLLILLALAILWDGTAISVLGLLAAITPMVLFSSSILNPSGPGITASLALGAAAFRIARDRARAPAWVFAALAVTGFVAILAGPIGPVFAAAFLLLGVVMLGRDGIRELWHQRPRPVALIAATLAIAVFLALLWRHYAGTAPGLFGISPLLRNLSLAVQQLPGVLRESLGTFGLETVPLPTLAYSIAWIFEFGLIVAAVCLARARDRLVLVVVTVLAIAFPVLFWAWIDRLTAFNLEGREVLPVLAMIPMAAGEVMYRSRHRWLGTRAGHALLTAALLAIAAFHGYAWWINAGANAGAPRTVLFYRAAVWTPPFGWAPWIALVLLAVLAMILFAVLGAGELSPKRSASPERRAPVPAS
jgi:hypothetical protein